MFVHLIADYGAGDLAFAEVHQRLALHLPGVTVVPTPVAPFDTLAAGFCVGQLALTEGPGERVVFHNVAPRQDAETPRPGNEGEELVLARLVNGTVVVGPNAGYAFSFVRDEALELREVSIPGTGSQFRSRDFFPELIAKILAGADDPLGPPVSVDAVPSVPERVVVYVDGYGNLKTTWTEPAAPSGTRITVSVGAVTATAVASDGTFEVEQDQLSFAPGSSGWPLRRGGERRYYELLLRGGSAADRFCSPTPGTSVHIVATD